MQSRWLPRFAAFFILLAAAGCYTTRPNLPKHAQSIAVPVFGNKTHYHDYTRKVEVELSEGVRRAFLSNGRLKVVPRDEADLILEGVVLKFERQTLRSDRLGEAVESQVRILCRVSLYDVREAKYMFKDFAVTNDQGRPDSGAYNLRRGEMEQFGRDEALEHLARNIADKVLDRW